VSYSPFTTTNLVHICKHVVFTYNYHKILDVTVSYELVTSADNRNLDYLRIRSEMAITKLQQDT